MLMSADGVITLTEEENRALAVPSVKAGRTEEPLVYIEVFHQLHCLVSIQMREKEEC